MKTAAMIAITALATRGVAVPQSHAQTRDDVGVLRLLTCQDSWMERKDDTFQHFVE